MQAVTLALHNNVTQFVRRGAFQARKARDPGIAVIEDHAPFDRDAACQGTAIADHRTGKERTKKANAMTRDQGGRRVNLIEPEKSLLLLKATASIAHEGGRRFAPDSPECAAFIAWLRDGAPDSPAPRLVKLEVTPGESVLIEPEASVQLQATAVFADGSRRDVTRLAVFEPNNQTAKVSAEGFVAREKSGG